MHNSWLTRALMVGTCVLPSILLTGEAEYVASAELLEATQLDRAVEEAVETAVQTLKQIVPGIVNYEEELKEFYIRQVKGEAVRQDVIALYANIFNEQELKDMTAFYRTEVGRKALDKLPEITQQITQIVQNHLDCNQDELAELFQRKQALLGM